MDKIVKQHRKSLSEITEQLQAPFYFYDLDALKEHLNGLQRDIQGSGIKLWYACKANPLSRILQTVHECGLMFDTASSGEMDQVLSLGVSPSNILLTGPAKSEALFEKAIEKGINTYVIESVNQLKWLNEAAAKKGIKPQVLLRIQLDWEDASESVLGGNEITPFGLEEGQWGDVQMKDYPHIDCQGFHVFQWGNILSIERLEEIWNHIFAVCTKLAKKMKVDLKVIDVGGGLGIPYDLDENSICWKKTCEVLKANKTKYHIPEVWMELGRYAIGPFGVFLTRVVDRKSVRGRDLLILESGLNHMVRPALTNQSFPCYPLKKEGKGFATYYLHGPLCTSLDYLGTYKLPGDIHPKDWLVMTQAGAYGFTESMPFFLCHELPAEVVLSGGISEVIRKPSSSITWLL